MVKTITTSYILYKAVTRALIIILITLFLNPSDNSLFLFGQNNNKNQQPNEQGEGEDDYYYLRGAVNSNSEEGKQVLEEHEKYICGKSSDKNTEFIQEYSIPVIACSQPVG